jgi:hypothetical protein
VVEPTVAAAASERGAGIDPAAVAVVSWLRLCRP